MTGAPLSFPTPVMMAVAPSRAVWAPIRPSSGEVHEALGKDCFRDRADAVGDA